MKTSTKKYPLLICMIISCAIVIASLFILGFFGMNLGTSLGGGSEFSVTMSQEADQTKYVTTVKQVVADSGLMVDSAFVEEKFVAGENNAEYTQRCLVVKIAKLDISDEVESKIQTALAEKLGINADSISAIDNITSVVKTKNVLFIGLAIGIIALCLFVMGWIRYDIFAAMSFILAYLHNIILYLSILILTRVQLNLISVGVMLILSIIMSAVLIQIYEKNRENTNMSSNEKLSATQLMMQSEKQSVKPYLFIGVAALVFALLLFLVPVASVRFTAINIIISLLVTAYTSLIIGPATYAALLEIKNYSQKATMSRNDTVNKAIKKKIKKNAKKSENA